MRVVAPDETDSPIDRANSCRSRCCNVNNNFANCWVIVEAPPAPPTLTTALPIALKSTPE